MIAGRVLSSKLLVEIHVKTEEQWKQKRVSNVIGEWNLLYFL